MMRLAALFACAWVVTGVAGAQTTSLPTPLPTEQAGTHMVRAAGMPLNDGALPPGLLTVRVVEGAFTRNLPDQSVQIHVEGGKVESARTGADGRAQFAHLPVGSRVHVSAVVNGERLESDGFDMPAAGGVRILLVAGGDGSGAATTVPSMPWTTPIAPPPSSTASVEAAFTRPEAIAHDSDGESGVMFVRGVLASATVMAFAAFVLNRRPRTR